LPPAAIIDYKPAHCSACRYPLHGDAPDPLVELPEKLRHVVHHRRHTLTCPCCQATTTAASVPEATSGFGLRCQDMTAHLSGVARMDKQPIRQLCDDLFGVPLALGSVSRLEAKTSHAREPIHAETPAAPKGRDANVDETGWKERSKKAWLWVAVTNLLSVFAIHPNRCRKAFGALIPDQGVLTTDRYPVYGHLESGNRQVCWAHLRRDFRAMIDRGDTGSVLGEPLLFASAALFWQ
jgi:transposase